MTGPDGWLFLAGLLLLGIGAICAAHIPGIAVIVDGQPHPDDPPCLDHGWACLADDYQPHPLPHQKGQR